MKHNPVALRRYDLNRIPFIKSMLRNRWPQLLLRVIALAGFFVVILAGIFGTPVGSRNLSIVFVWIAWWAMLILVAVPLFGRGWCSICPIPMPGEWLQQGALLKPQQGGYGLARRWPNRLRNIWIQNGAFVLVALFSTVVLTQPLISALVLAAFIVIAMTASLIFERRAFCRYLCPVGGFIGLYSQLAPVELRVKNRTICASHSEKTCYTGNADGYGCPWQVFPGALVKNTYCGTCMECLRTCPHDNLAINLRPFGADLERVSGRKLDEAIKAFIMLGSAIVYSVVMLGTWGALKSAAYSVGSLQWLLYAVSFLFFMAIVLPGTFYICVAIGQYLAERGIKGNGSFSFHWRSLKKPFIAFAYALVPLGLSAWIAFSLSFVFANISYLWPALSDPFGWGWNLMGTAGMTWSPYLTQVVPAFQVIVMLIGLFWASRTIRRTATQLGTQTNSPNRFVIPDFNRWTLPVLMYCLVVTASLLGLLIA